VQWNFFTREFNALDGCMMVLHLLATFETLAVNSLCQSRWRCPLFQELTKIVVHARNGEVRLALKRTTHIVDAMLISGEKLDNREDEILRFVE
jgi:hypothetical protein